jgi:hypothetical protein
MEPWNEHSRVCAREHTHRGDIRFHGSTVSLFDFINDIIGLCHVSSGTGPVPRFHPHPKATEKLLWRLWVRVQGVTVFGRRVGVRVFAAGAWGQGQAAPACRPAWFSRA